MHMHKYPNIRDNQLPKRGSKESKGPECGQGGVAYYWEVISFLISVNALCVLFIISFWCVFGSISNSVVK